MENVITMNKMIGLLFCLPSSLLFLKTPKIQGMSSPCNGNHISSNKPILIRSMLAASIVQDTFAGEAVENEGGEEETTGGYFYCYFYWYIYCSG